MPNKIIAIGGTGIKCLEAFVHYCAILKTEKKYDVLIIEADKSNKNLERLNDTISKYIKMQKLLYINNDDKRQYGYGGVFCNLIDEKSEKKFRVWNPDRNPKTDNTLNTIEGFNESKLANALYTYDEKNENLDEGFVGHPSIGSLIAALKVNFSDKEWKDFIGEESNVMGNEEKTKIFILGSIFGGTGASGIYTFANKILNYEFTREKEEGQLKVNYKKEVDNDKIAICLGMMTPYYIIPNKNENKNSIVYDTNNKHNLTVKDGDILDNSCYALKFYSESWEHINKVSTVMIGNSKRENLVKRDYNDINQKTTWTEEKVEYSYNAQKNPSLISELIMALCMYKFFDKDLEKGMVYIPIKKINDSKSKAYISNESLSCSYNEFFNDLGNMLKTSICFSRKLYPEINKFRNIEITKEDLNRFKWLEILYNDMNKGSDSKNLVMKHADIAKNYYDSFFLWIINTFTIEYTPDEDNEITQDVINEELLKDAWELSKYLKNKQYGDIINNISSKFKKKWRWKRISKVATSILGVLSDIITVATTGALPAIAKLIIRLFTIGGENNA